jgi:hypothetical protein
MGGKSNAHGRERINSYKTSAEYYERKITFGVTGLKGGG